MPSFTPAYLGSLPIAATLLEQIDRLGYARGAQQAFRTQAPEVLRHLTTVARIESTESSTRLEGAAAPRERTEGIVLRDAAPTNRSEADMAGCRDAYRMIHEHAEHMRLRESQILELHGRLYRYLPAPGGRYEATQNDIVETDEAAGVVRIRFSPTSPVRTPGGMRGLVEGCTRRPSITTRWRTAGPVGTRTRTTRGHAPAGPTRHQRDRARACRHQSRTASQCPEGTPGRRRTRAARPRARGALRAASALQRAQG